MQKTYAAPAITVLGSVGALTLGVITRVITYS
jgi:hypothetical protein